MQLSISPAVAQYITGALTVAGIIATASPSVFPSFIPPGVVKDIIQTCGLLSLIGAGLFGTGASRYSSSEPGPGAPPDPPAVQAATLKAQQDTIAAKLAAVTTQPESPKP